MLFKKAKNIFPEKPFHIYDMVIFIILLVFCFFSYSQGDIIHSGFSSLAYLKGHFLDFYEYNADLVSANSYLPSTYILFSIWNIPIELFKINVDPSLNISLLVLYWFKLLPTIFYFLSSIMLYKISVTLGMENNIAKLCAYTFLATPIGFYSQIIFGQYDIFTVFFLLLGLYYYLKNSHMKFLLFMGIAMTFKYFALLLFIPLLLLKYKDIAKIIKSIIIYFIPMALEVLIYLPSKAFRAGVFGFNANSYFLDIGFDISFMGKLSLIPFLWLALCAFCFFYKPKNDNDLMDWSLYVCCLTMFIIFGMSLWHPQWLLIAMPFLVLSSFKAERPDVFFLIDIGLSVMFFAIVVNGWPTHLDEGLFNLGVWQKLYPINFSFREITANKFFPISVSLAFTIFSALLFISTVFKHPKFNQKVSNISLKSSWNIVRIRFLSILVFIIPTCICFILAMNGMFFAYNINEGDSFVLEKFNNSSVISQEFQSNLSEIKEIQAKFGTYEQANKGIININLVDVENENIVFSTEFNADELEDNLFSTISFDDVKIEKERIYRIDFRFEVQEDDLLSIYGTNKYILEDDIHHNAIIDGNIQDYDLCMKIIGKM